jgi:hypothetical protein
MSKFVTREVRKGAYHAALANLAETLLVKPLTHLRCEVPFEPFPVDHVPFA